MGRKWGPCAAPRCPVLTAKTYCDTHAPEPWKGSTRKARLPGNWATLVRFVLERDDRRCYICGRPAGRVDHVIAGDNHHPSNLAAICYPCDMRKSGSEGGRRVHQRRATHE